MKILGIESSAKAASICIWQDGKILADMYCNNGLTHSKTILLMIENMLKQTGENFKNFDKIAIAYGPGSFTGLRIGAAVAKGLSWASGISCTGVSTLEAMAQNVSSFNGVVAPVMDARAGQVYNALFEVQKGMIKRLCSDRAIALKDLSHELKTYPSVKLLGDGAEMCYQKLSNDVLGLELMPENIRFPRAWGVCECAKNQLGVSADSLKLEYIRLPQAERERLARLNVF